MKGFSETNIKYIRRWYSFYMKGLQGVAEIENNDSNSKRLQAVAQFDERVINHIKPSIMLIKPLRTGGAGMY